MLCASCSKEAAEMSEEGSRTLTLQVTNYKQYLMDEEGTRAASSIDTLENLALAIFDGTTGELKQDIIKQKKGDKGYGTYSVTLPYGKYQLAFVGFNGSRSLKNFTANEISFEEDYVPHTFLCNKELTVNDETSDNQSITLKRAVAAFKLIMKDTFPTNVKSMTFQPSNGGAALNPKTGLSATNAGSTSTYDVTSIQGKEGSSIINYLFIPSNPTAITYVVTALDSKGNIVRQRKFTDVPMQVNYKTTYEGEFFGEDDMNGKMQVQVDMDWAGETTHEY